MSFTVRNMFICTRVLFIKRSVKYDILRFAIICRLAKLLVACPSAIREIGQTNRPLGRPRAILPDPGEWLPASSASVAANDGNPPEVPSHAGGEDHAVDFALQAVPAPRVTLAGE